MITGSRMRAFDHCCAPAAGETLSVRKATRIPATGTTTRTTIASGETQGA